MRLDTDKMIARKDGHIGWMIFNNPERRNAVSLAMREAMAQIFEAWQEDREVRVLIMRGAGDKAFCAGADLKERENMTMVEVRQYIQYIRDTFTEMENLPIPVIAAINGFAMGGGLECALACDIRIVETQSKLALPEATVGLLPCGGGTQNLAWLVGEGWAKRMILCGERIDAATAEKIGLAEEVVGTGEALDRALALAENVGRQSPPAVAACKSLIQEARGGNIDAAYAVERTAFVDLFDTKDQAEGVNAFLEKRAPEWVNG